MFTPLNRVLSVAIALLLSAVSAAHGETIAVSATAGPTTPTPSLVGQDTKTTVSASLTAPAHPLGSPMFHWSFPTVLYSPPGSSAETLSSGPYYAFFDNPGSAVTIFHAELYTAGQWQFGLRVDVSDYVQVGYTAQLVGGTAFTAANPVVVIPVAPSPVAPSPVGNPVASPVAPGPVTISPVGNPVANPVAPSPVAPGPVTISPVGNPVPSPVAPSPVAPSPVAPKPAAAKLIVKRRKDGVAEYKLIEGKFAVALPGEYMDLKAEDANGGKLTNVQWTIPDKSFKEYTADNNKGVLTLLKAADLKSATVQFYWADSGNKTVKVTATAGGVQEDATAILSVKKPTATFTAEQGVVYVGPVKRGKKVRQKLALVKNEKGQLPGMKFAGNIKVPAGFVEGDWCFVQLVSLIITKEVKIKDTKQIFVQDTKGTKALDTQFPYDATTLTGNADVTNDTPWTYLDDVAELTRVTRADEFSMYLLFMPDGAHSRYVPLLRLNWTWKGTAAKKAGVWDLVPGSKGKSNGDKDDGNSVPEINHPTWEKNIEEYKLEEVK